MKNTENMKKVLTIFIVAALIFSSAFVCFGSDFMSVPELGGTIILKLNLSQAVVDNNLTYIDVDLAVVPFTENGRTLIPLRFVSEALGGEIEWDEVSQTIDIEFPAKKIFFRVGENIMYDNGTKVELETAPKIYNSRTLVPIRALAEALGKRVSFEDGWIAITENNVLWEGLAQNTKSAIYNSIYDCTFNDQLILQDKNNSGSSSSSTIPENPLNKYFKGNPLSTNAYVLNGGIVFPIEKVNTAGAKKFNDNLKDKNLKIKSLDMPLVLMEDGTLYQLTYNSTKQGVTMTLVYENVADFSVGDRFAIILRKDGRVYTKTSVKINEFITTATKPINFNLDVRSLHGVNMVDLRGQVKSVFAGREACFVIKNDGTLWAWGSNLKGKLGTGNEKDVPAEDIVEIVGIPEPQFITSALNHTLCIDKDGFLWAWGENAESELTTEFGKKTLKPTRFAGIRDVKYVTTAADYTMVVKTDGTVWVAGDNDRGKLGLHTIRRALEWTQITELSDVVYAKASDYYHLNGNSSVVTKDGTMYVWGSASPTRGSVYSKLNDIKPIKYASGLDVSSALD